MSSESRISVPSAAAETGESAAPPCAPCAASAVDLIRRFGGPSKLAQALGTNQSTVSMWNERGIPGKWHLPLLRLARERGVALSEDELLETTRK